MPVDYPGGYYDNGLTRETLESVQRMSITDEEKDKILTRNAVRLLALAHQAESQKEIMKPQLTTEERETIDLLTGRFCPRYDSMKILAANRSVVVDVGHGSESFILKVSRDLNTLDKVTAFEADWINYLYRNKVGVPRLIRSTSNQLVERVSSGDMAFSCYCYEKVPVDTSDKEYWSDSHFIQELGSTMGKMHTLAESYEIHEIEKAPSWDSPEWIRNPEGYFHPSQSGVVVTIHKLREQISTLLKDTHYFGLIHDDLHKGNVVRANGELVILDFECLHLNWFVAEIASTILFRTWIGPEKEKTEVKQAAMSFLRNLLIGYVREHDLDDIWYKQLPLFLKLREVSLFATYFIYQDIGNYGDKSLFNYVYHSISENKPFLDVDFTKEFGAYN
ncbi:phosphotransferase [Chloroflexota bacterium]